MRSVLAMGLAVLAACPVASGAHGPVRMGAIAPGAPTLRNAAALGTLVRIDAKRGLAQFRISCGWYYKPRRKVTAGLWAVDLRRLSFGWASNPADLSRGHVDTVSRATWERRAERRGWSGTLRLSGRRGDVSNGPTTDICGGVLGS